jgi:hypothetical protein
MQVWLPGSGQELLQHKYVDFIVFAGRNLTRIGKTQRLVVRHAVPAGSREVKVNVEFNFISERRAQRNKKKKIPSTYSIGYPGPHVSSGLDLVTKRKIHAVSGNRSSPVQPRSPLTECVTLAQTERYKKYL